MLSALCKSQAVRHVPDVLSLAQLSRTIRFGGILFNVLPSNSNAVVGRFDLSWRVGYEVVPAGRHLHLPRRGFRVPNATLGRAPEEDPPINWR